MQKGIKKYKSVYTAEIAKKCKFVYVNDYLDKNLTLSPFTNNNKEINSFVNYFKVNKVNFNSKKELLYNFDNFVNNQYGNIDYKFYHEYSIYLYNNIMIKKLNYFSQNINQKTWTLRHYIKLKKHYNYPDLLEFIQKYNNKYNITYCKNNYSLIDPVVHLKISHPLRLNIFINTLTIKEVINTYYKTVADLEKFIAS